MSIAGQETSKVTVGDLSEGGAHDGAGGLLACTVRASEAGRLLAFDLDAAMTESLRTLLARLDTRPAA